MLARQVALLWGETRRYTAGVVLKTLVLISQESAALPSSSESVLLILTPSLAVTRISVRVVASWCASAGEPKSHIGTRFVMSA